jgi:class 3 adenylate cyclase
LKAESTNIKLNEELLSKQTEIALKISRYAYLLCLVLFLILKFILDVDGFLPFIFLSYSICSFLNNSMYRFHGRIVIVSNVFFALAFLYILLISLFSGGLTSPFVSMSAVSIVGSFISGLKHGRFFLALGIIVFSLLFLFDIMGWVPDHGFTEIQQRYFALLTYAFNFTISGAAGLIIAKTSFRGYQAKKEVDKQKLIIEKSRKEIELEKEKSDNLLLNILPVEIAEELKEKGSADTRLIDFVTVLFTDFKGFTALSEILSSQDLVKEINICFSTFDHIMEKHNIEKIKTIGDSYMAAGGLPTVNETHAQDVVKAALEIQQFMLDLAEKKKANNEPFFEIRIGVHTGPVIAGIVGVKKFQYDIWGDTVNTASRMESSGNVGKVNISESTYQIVKNNDEYSFESRGKIEAKGKGLLEMFFVERKDMSGVK